jgi:hypothetical protein
MDTLEPHYFTCRYLMLMAVGTEPACECVKLDRNAEIIVAPKQRSSKDNKNTVVKSFREMPQEWHSTSHSQWAYGDWSVIINGNDTTADEGSWIYIQNINYDVVCNGKEGSLKGAYAQVVYSPEVEPGHIVLPKATRKSLCITEPYSRTRVLSNLVPWSTSQKLLISYSNGDSESVRKSLECNSN